MIIRHLRPVNNWTKIDNHVAINANISDGAYRLYGYLCGLRDGADYKDTLIIKALGLSKATLARRKKELTDNGLIYTKQLYPRVYILYIGNSKYPAINVMKEWEDIEDA